MRNANSGSGLRRTGHRNQRPKLRRPAPAETRNVQFHRRGNFRNWREFNQPAEGEALRVKKRVRSLSDRHDLANACGLKIVDLVRSERELSSRRRRTTCSCCRRRVDAAALKRWVDRILG
jgi:hypothetical protein